MEWDWAWFWGGCSVSLSVWLLICGRKRRELVAELERRRRELAHERMFAHSRRKLQDAMASCAERCICGAFQKD